MKTISVKSLLLMTAYIFTVHASDKQTLLFTQDEYSKMETDKLTDIKRCLKISIKDVENDEIPECCGSVTLLTGLSAPSLIVAAPVGAHFSGEPIPEYCGPVIVGLLGACAASSLGSSLYKWWVTRPQEAELSKVKLALRKKKLDGGEKQD